MKELMDLPNREFTAFYHAAWKKSVDEAMAAEAAQRAQEMENKKAASRNAPPPTSRQLVANMPTMTSSDIEELMDEIS